MQERTHEGHVEARNVTLKVPPDARYGGYVRAQIVALAREGNVHEDALADFATAVGEALANAIEHAHSLEPIEVRCSLDRAKLLAVVTDRGRGFDVHEHLNRQLPDVLSERGRGIALMRRCCDIVEVKSSPAGTQIVLGLLLARPARARSAVTMLHRRPRGHTASASPPIERYGEA